MVSLEEADWRLYKTSSSMCDFYVSLRLFRNKNGLKIKREVYFVNIFYFTRWIPKLSPYFDVH